MSDIRDPDYLDFLKKDYIAYQYNDFPELKALVSGDNGRQIDNAMLYSIEKNIFRYADVKFVRSNRAPELIYTNFSLRIPWTHRFFALYTFLKHRSFKNYFKYRKYEKILDKIRNCFTETR